MRREGIPSNSSGKPELAIVDELMWDYNALPYVIGKYTSCRVDGINNGLLQNRLHHNGSNARTGTILPP